MVGAKLLMKVLRGEDIDWRKIEDTYTPSRHCTGCGFTRFKDEYFQSQWTRTDGCSVCRKCVEAKKSAGTPLECMGCHSWKALSAFAESDHHFRRFLHRRCFDCSALRECSECKIAKGSNGVCAACLARGIEESYRFGEVSGVQQGARFLEVQAMQQQEREAGVSRVVVDGATPDCL